MKIDISYFNADRAMLIILHTEPLAIIYLGAQQFMQIKAALFKCVQGEDFSSVPIHLRKKNGGLRLEKQDMFN